MQKTSIKAPYQSPSIEIVKTSGEPIMMSALELYYLKMYANGDDYDNEDIDDYDLF
mgnify:CR=1 FL=1